VQTFGMPLKNTVNTIYFHCPKKIKIWKMQCCLLMLCCDIIFLWIVYSMLHKWPWHNHNLLGKEPFDVTFKVHEKWVTLSVYCETNLNAYPWHCWVKGDITEIWVETFGVVSHQNHYFDCMCGMCNYLVNATNIKKSFWRCSRSG
jgi:hypothetical protein